MVGYIDICIFEVKKSCAHLKNVKDNFRYIFSYFVNDPTVFFFFFVKGIFMFDFVVNIQLHTALH